MRIRPDKFPERLRQSFGVSTAAGLFGKAHRELTAYRESNDMLRTADHAFNFCVSAWQLVDWVFKDMSDQEREHVGDYLGKPIKTQTELAIAVQKACPSLKICRVIATAGKHVTVDYYPDRTISTALHLDGSHPHYKVRWSLTYAGEICDAVEIFENALKFWDGLLRRIGWLEAIFVDSQN
ncbi:hypothetical protein [Caballeronia mineralivorans]|jgi:hypothetical protein|uniref:hypothetical protein n=1 Tax=Caballeronia mineralivorans TaxID=2010198 RepID=UPI0023F1A2F6|nr:hypothetical protein [Caballeronia mineralivorans]MDB5783823.1 hypothetical protein [Caballeronia mineralivorans]